MMKYRVKNTVFKDVYWEMIMYDELIITTTYITYETAYTGLYTTKQKDNSLWYRKIE